MPDLDGSQHRLLVDGHVSTPLDLSLDDLKGRTVRAVSGDPWAAGAIGNAKWTGVQLADVLRSAGAVEDLELHVAFCPLDECDVDGKQFTYGSLDPDAEGSVA